MRWKPWAACLLLLLAVMPVRAADDFDDSVRLIRTEAGAHRLILLGEQHGTREIPDLVAALVRSYAAGEPVLLGLEVPRQEHAALRRYLGSDGGAQARATLRAGRFWQADDDRHDGRCSHDMLDLIEDVRLLRADGHDVAILPFDIRPYGGNGSEARDRAMAQRVRVAYSALPRGRLLVLAGNVHAMLRKPDRAPAQMQTPMGQHLRNLDPYAVNIGATTGQLWACRAGCGPVDARTSYPRSGPIRGGFYDGVFDLQVVLPAFTVARLIGAPPATR